MPSRRIFAALAIAAVTLALGYGAYWYAVGGMIRDGISQWAEVLRAEGLEVAYEDLTVGGFPGRFVITLTQPTLARPGWRWSAPRLIAEACFFTLDCITVTLPKTQRLDVERSGEAIELTLGGGIAHLALIDGALARLAFEAEGMILVTPRGLFSLAAIEGLIRRRSETGLAVEFDGRGLVLPTGVNPVLGREIAALGVTASLDEDLPKGLSSDALVAWSAAGGVVEIERLDLEWGAVAVAAKGTLTLDEERRPEAAFSAEITGYGGLLDALAESGRMKPRDASFAKTFLNLMAKKSSGRRVVKAAVTAQNGKLFVGPLPLIRLDPINW